MRLRKNYSNMKREHLIKECGELYAEYEKLATNEEKKVQEILSEVSGCESADVNYTGAMIFIKYKDLVKILNSVILRK